MTYYFGQSCDAKPNILSRKTLKCYCNTVELG